MGKIAENRGEGANGAKTIGQCDQKSRKRSWLKGGISHVYHNLAVNVFTFAVAVVKKYIALNSDIVFSRLFSKVTHTHTHGCARVRAIAS